MLWNLNGNERVLFLALEWVFLARVSHRLPGKVKEFIRRMEIPKSAITMIVEWGLVRSNLIDFSRSSLWVMHGYVCEETVFYDSEPRGSIAVIR